MHIGTMVEFAFALVAKLDAINKHSFNDFKLRVGTLCRGLGLGRVGACWGCGGRTMTSASLEPQVWVAGGRPGAAVCPSGHLCTN